MGNIHGDGEVTVSMVSDEPGQLKLAEEIEWVNYLQSLGVDPNTAVCTVTTDESGRVKVEAAVPADTYKPYEGASDTAADQPVQEGQSVDAAGNVIDATGQPVVDANGQPVPAQPAV